MQSMSQCVLLRSSSATPDPLPASERSISVFVYLSFPLLFIYTVGLSYKKKRAIFMLCVHFISLNTMLSRSSISCK